MGLAGLKHLANALKCNISLRALSLANNNLNEAGAEHLVADIIIVNKCLLEIDLSGNLLGGVFDVDHDWCPTPEKVMVVIANALRYSTRWERCDLRENGLTKWQRVKLVAEFSTRLLL